jgi:hypothetical protein
MTRLLREAEGNRLLRLARFILLDSFAVPSLLASPL